MVKQNRWIVAAIVCVVVCDSLPLAAETKNEPALHLPFWDQADVRDPLGRLEFRAALLEREPGFAQGYPAMQYGCEAPREDGSAWVYGWRLANWQERATRTIEIVRVSTRDGRLFTNEETVLSVKNSDWQGFVNLVRRPTDGRLFFFGWSAGELQVYSSNDGQKWELTTKKAYPGHDAMNIIWYPPLDAFVNFQNTLHKHSKRYPDNVGEYRRVLSFLKSADGVSWEGFSPQFLKNEKYWTPDEQDPVDLEFYRSVVFPVQGRYAMLLEDYIAPPPEANSRRKSSKHGPLGEVEWATSRDGLNWQRPYREINVIDQVGVLAIQGPLRREGMLRFYERNGAVNSLTDGRIFYVTGRGNCEFSTPEFTMPAQGLTSDANTLYLPRDGMNGRAYLMAELRDETNRAIPGYERTKCLFENKDGRALPLAWDGKTGSDLNGKKLHLRLYFRDAKLYSVSGGE